MASTPPESVARIDEARAAWLDAKRTKSASERTYQAYAATLDSFRRSLQSVGLDLDGDLRVVARALHTWAGHGDPAPATFNQRLAVVSSFYAYASRAGFLAPGNPADFVDRRVTPGYRARALSPETVQECLKAIDRTTFAGLRDYALLAVALATGRRLAEIAALRWEHVTQTGARVTLDFLRVKGGKAMRDTLPPATSQALMCWLRAWYGEDLANTDPRAPLWPALARSRGAALTPRQIQNICRERLHTHFHALRHTFARAMDVAGAPVTVTQARLGHASLATTSRYLAALRSAENPYGAHVEALLLGENGNGV